MKDLIWLGSTLDDIKSFPDEVQDEMGYALHCAQIGETHPSAKLFKGHGSGIYEIVSNFNSDAYRAVYIVNLDDCLYVLHAFQKKSKSGIKTPKTDLTVIETRLKLLKSHLKMRCSMNNRDELTMTKSSGNVFKDLGYTSADEHLLKAKFAVVINNIIKEKNLTQTEAANILGIDQPKVSRLVRGILSGFSIDKLIIFLISLNQDIEINVKPHKNKRINNFDSHFSLHYIAGAAG